MLNQSKGIRKPFPYVDVNITFIIVGINIALYFIIRVIPSLRAYLGLNLGTLIYYKMYWTPITYMFTHFTMNHIIFNMLGLFFFGPQLERRMGSWEFLTFYMVSGILSGLFSLILYFLMGQGVYMIGASGAIYAILLAFAVYFPNSTVYLFFVLPIKTKYIVLLFTAISLLMQISGGGGSVAHLAHLAGFGIAFLYFIIRIGINPITAFKDSRNSPWQ